DRLASENVAVSAATVMTTWFTVEGPGLVTSRWSPIFPPLVTFCTPFADVPISGLRATVSRDFAWLPTADPTATKHTTIATTAAKNIRFRLIPLPFLAPCFRGRLPDRSGPSVAWFCDCVNRQPIWAGPPRWQ